MEWYLAFALLAGTVIALMAIGMPVAFAFLCTNIVGGLVFIGGYNSLLQMVDNSTSLITTFTLAPVPLFVLLGSLFFHTGIALRVFDALDMLFGRLPGRLCYITLAGGTLFSTLTGSTMANTAMLGSLMVPEMRRRGYSSQMSMGPILGTGGLAMIIPPSSLAVLLASIAGLDVGGLLIAGLIPGLVLAGLYAGTIFLMVKINPDSAPSYDIVGTQWRQKLNAIVFDILPMALVVFLVVGFIVLGISTPSEAAAFGVLGVLILATVYKKLTWKSIVTSLDEVVRISGMIFFIIINSVVFSQLLALSGASSGMLHWATGFDAAPVVVVLIMVLVLLILGMFIDQISMMLITVPIFFPVVLALGYDPLWFALIMLISLEMSLTTPPFGMLLFVILGVAPKGTTLGQVALSATPYLTCDAILIALLILFPAVSLYLPYLMS